MSKYTAEEINLLAASVLVKAVDKVLTKQVNEMLAKKSVEYSSFTKGGPSNNGEETILGKDPEVVMGKETMKKISESMKGTPLADRDPTIASGLRKLYVRSKRNQLRGKSDLL